jgi:hypothetical protein
MSLTESTACREASLSGRLTFLDSGTGSARVRIYGGTRPAVTSDPGTPLLVEIPLQEPAGGVAAGVLTLLPSGPGTIASTGSAAWARVVNGSGATAFDTDVGLDGSGANVILSDLTLYAGGLVSILSASLS